MKKNSISQHFLGLFHLLIENIFNLVIINTQFLRFSTPYGGKMSKFKIFTIIKECKLWQV